MISLDLTRSSEVRKAGDQSNRVPTVKKACEITHGFVYLLFF